MPIRSSTQAARTVGRISGKAVTRLGRSATPDHTGTAKLLASLPPMAFIDTLLTVVVTVLCSLMGALASAALFFVLIAVALLCPIRRRSSPTESLFRITIPVEILRPVLRTTA